MLLIIFLGFIKSKPCLSQTIKVFKKCVNLHEIATDRSQTTDLNNSRPTTRYHAATALTAFVHYNSACRPLLSQSGLRGGRGVRAVGVATLHANSVKKQSINAKSEPSK